MNLWIVYRKEKGERKGKRQGDQIRNMLVLNINLSGMGFWLKTLICNNRPHRAKLKKTEQLPVNLNSGERNCSETKTGLEAKIL